METIFIIKMQCQRFLLEKEQEIIIVIMSCRKHGLP